MSKTADEQSIMANKRKTRNHDVRKDSVLYRDKKKKKINDNNEDPFSMENPTNKHHQNGSHVDDLQSKLNKYSFTTSHNKSANKSSKHLSRSKMEWEGWSNLDSKDKNNKFKIQSIEYQWDHLQLSKRKKSNKTKITTNKTYDIWVTISHKTKKLLDFNVNCICLHFHIFCNNE